MKIRQLITSTLFALIFGLMAPMGAALANTAEETFAKAVAAVHDGDDEQAITILEPLANAGDPKGMSLLGQLIYGATDDEEGKKKARKWLVRAAEAGDPNAMTVISGQYLSGVEMQVSKKKIKNFLMEAAEQGDPRAQSLLGLSFSTWQKISKNGRIFGRNDSKSKYWSAKALKNEELSAKEILFFHELTKHELRIAGREKYRRKIQALADEGFVLPSLLLGQIYMKGLDVPKDLYKAAKWFRIASYFNGEDSLDEEARRKLGGVFEKASNLSNAWFRDLMRDEGTRYGIAAKWCVLHKKSNIVCLRNAVYHHGSCRPPYFPGYFENFVSSLGYDRCRNEMLAEESLDLMSFQLIENRGSINA